MSTINTAILVIDIQNDFKKIIANDMVKSIIKLVQYAHIIKTKIIWIKSYYNSSINISNDNVENLSDELRLKGTHTGKKICEKNTYGANIIDELLPFICEDKLIIKTFYSSFTGTDLDYTLKNLNIKNLLICGLTINTCIMATTIDAKELGYDITILSDCITAFSENKYNFGLEKIKKYAEIKTSLDIINNFDNIGLVDSFILYDILPIDIYDNDTFDKLIVELDWKNMSIKDTILSRLVCVQADETLNGLPIYRNPSDIYIKAVNFTDTIKKMIDYLNLKLNLKHKLNHVFIKYYRNGTEGIGKHSDKTLDILPESHIVNLSLGATRYMTLTKKDDSSIKKKIKLTSNSVFLIGMETNKKYFHEVKSDKRQKKEKTADELLHNEGRMSLTFRSIGTFIKDEKLYGQGGPKYNSNIIDDSKDLTMAFGEENSNPNFDWIKNYGKGFYALSNS
jgi:nicotinamidase-related amidase